MSDQTSNPLGSPKIQDITSKDSKEPQEFREFEALTEKLVNVPKEEVDEKRRERN